MSQYKISKKRLAEIIKEEYDAAMERTDEAHCGGDHAGNRDEKKMKKESLDSIRTLIQQELKNL